MAKGSRGRKILKWLGGVVGALAIAVVVLGWYVLRTEQVKIDDQVFVILGGGGNTLVLKGDDGPLVVDTKFFLPAGRVKDAVEKECGKPPKMVINTHYHFDHTGGNPKFVGAEFVGATTTPVHMREQMAGTFGPGGAGERAVPTTLVASGKQFNFGDDYVDVEHFGRGHTDGDVIVFLHKRSILHTGDLFFNGYYPVVDPPGGGSVREWGPTLDKVIAMSPGTIVPGHGPLAKLDELKRFRKYIGALWDWGYAEAKAGKSRDEAIAGFDDGAFGLKPLTGISSKAKNVGAAFDEAKAWIAAGH